MMTERQRQFRENYQSNINPTYNGLLHVCVLYGVGITAIYYCAQHLIGAGWEWLLVIPVFLAGNFVEWGMHRFVMHRRVNVWGLRSIYERHTREHHHELQHEPDVPDRRLVPGQHRPAPRSHWHALQWLQ